MKTFEYAYKENDQVINKNKANSIQDAKTFKTKRYYTNLLKSRRRWFLKSLSQKKQ